MTSRLRRAREIAGLSLGQAARRLGTSTTALSDFEMGESTPSAATIRVLASLYCVSISWLSGADPVIADDVRRAIDTAILSNADRASLIDVIGAICTPDDRAPAPELDPEVTPVCNETARIALDESHEPYVVDYDFEGGAG